MPATIRGSDNQSNTGMATLLNGQTTVVVSHGLTEIPEVVLVTPRTLGSAAWARVSARTKDTFTVTVSANPGANIEIDWLAAIGLRTAF